MRSLAAAMTVVRSTTAAAADAFAPHRGQHSRALLHLFFSLGLFGVFLVSIVDSSFVPLPIPGITDIMIVIMAARHSNWFLLVLAAGALKMSRKKFMTTFTVSRTLRHSITAWLGVHYGRHVLNLWNRLSAQYAVPVLIVIWTTILISCATAFWKLYKTSRTVVIHPETLAGDTRTAA